MTDATPLPVALYRDREAFRYERAALFGPSWQMLAPDTAIDAPGGYLATEIGGWPVLAVRAEDGVLRAFHNVCPGHKDSQGQAAPLIAPGQGKIAAIQAPDGTVYGLDGSVQQAASASANPPAALHPLAIGTWRGLIFVASAPPPASLEESLSPFEIPIPDLGSAAFVPAGTLVTDIACDWKTFLDFAGALESPAGQPADSFLGIAVSNRKGCIIRNIDPADAEAVWVWIWPSLGIHKSRQGVVVCQIFANGREGTRLVHHFHARTAAEPGSDMAAAWQAIASRQKAAAEAAQALLDAGETPVATLSPTSYGLHRILGTVLDPRGWDMFRQLAVERVVQETADVVSLYLTAADGGRLPPFHPGAFLTCRLRVPGRERPVIRNYSLSDRPGTGTYRLTVRRDDDSPASSYLCDLRPGDRFESLMPRGSLRIDDEATRPVVLLSAGIGVTPMIGVLTHRIAATGAAAGVGRPLWFLHGARNGAEHILGAEVRRLAAGRGDIHLHVAYSRPGPSDALGRDYDSAGRLGIERVKALLPDADADFYLCGPMGFMRDLHRGLRAWGVPKERIRYEFFGVAEAFEAPAQPAPPVVAATPAEGDPVFNVTFARSGVRATWCPAEGSLLELAETHGINPPFSCRDGECMVCFQVVLDGEVQYWRRGDDPRTPGLELLCVSYPKSDVVVDI